jgi:hypothetical protein
LFLLEKSEQSSSVLLLFLIGESIAHPRSAPCQSSKSTKLIQQLKFSYYHQETKRPTKTKTKIVFSLLNFFPYKTKQTIWSQKSSWTARTAIIGNPLLWRWLRLFCFVLSKFFFWLKSLQQNRDDHQQARKE